METIGPERSRAPLPARKPGLLRETLMACKFMLKFESSPAF